MSSFIPMVSSSPPPMDEGGGFEWDDDDDDFGTFASADTNSSFKVESFPPVDMNQSNDSGKLGMKEEFADFAAFENKIGSFSMDSDSAFTPNDIRPGTIPINQSDSTKDSTEQESNQSQNTNSNGPLTDSGMFSSDVSPVPLHEEQGTTEDKCGHSESLEDINSDSLSDKTDCKVNADTESVSDDTNHLMEAKEEMSNEIKNNDIGNAISAKETTPQSVIGNEDECLTLEETSVSDTNSANPGSVVNEGDPKMCSSDTNKTSIDNDSIPNTEIHHSTTDCDTNNVSCTSGNKGNTEDFQEPTHTDRDSSESVTENQIVTKSEKEEGNETVQYSDLSTSGDLSRHKSGIPETNVHHADNNGCLEQNQVFVDSENVKTYINDTVISEAVRKFSESESMGDAGENDDTNAESVQGQSETQIGDLTKSMLQNSNSETYQDSSHTHVISGEKALGIEQDKSTENDVAHDLDAVSDSTVNTESEISHIPVHTHQENVTDDFGDFGSVSQTPLNTDMSSTSVDNDHISQTNSQNTSPELSSGDNQSGDAASNDDDFSDFSKPQVLDHEPESSGKGNDNDIDADFGDFNSVQGKSDLTVGESASSGITTDSSSKAVNDINDDGDDFGDFNAGQIKSELTAEDSTNPSAGTDGDDDDFGDFNAGQIKSEFTSESLSVVADGDPQDDDDFGDFNAGTSSVAATNDSSTSDQGGGFAAFTSKSSEASGDNWAAFGEPQTAVSVPEVNDEDDWGDFGDESQTAVSGVTIDDDADEDWGDFGDESGNAGTQAVKLSETQQPLPTVSLQNMTKHEKLVYAVTSCFPDVKKEGSMVVEDLENSEQKSSSSSPNLWVQIKTLQSTREVSYQWSKSEWNSQLFTTLHIDTRNVLIGHKKAQVPIFASGLTLLEPVKGSGTTILKPDVLVDTMKIDTVVSHSQESIPPAQFDWTSSGLTNPLEANNKTLNLDFLIQDLSSKSTELESEFLGPDSAQLTKPTIQPLENILANLKTSSTFKPLNQTDDISNEAQKVVQSLPNLSFMKSRVLMFPLHMD